MRGGRLGLAGVFLLAVAARLLALPDAPAELTGDEPEYHALAVSLVSGRGFADPAGTPTAQRDPGLPGVLAAVYAVAGPRPVAARVVLAVLAAAAAPLLVLLGLAALPSLPAAAWTGGLLWALYPRGAVLATLLYGEGLAATLVVAALLAAERARRAPERGGGPRAVAAWGAAAGVLAGAAVLVRPYLVLFAAVPVLLPLLPGRGAGRGRGAPPGGGARAARLRGAAAAALAVAVVVGPWVVRNAVVLGYPGLGTRTQVFWLGNHPAARGSWPGAELERAEADLRARHPGVDTLAEAARARVLTREGLELIAEEPGRFAALAPRKVAVFLSPASYLGLDLLYLVLLPFMVLGAVRAGRTEGALPLVLLLAPAAALLPVVLLTFGDPRFRHPVDPPLFLLAAVGLTAVGSRLAARLRARPAARVRPRAPAQDRRTGPAAGPESPA